MTDEVTPYLERLRSIGIVTPKLGHKVTNKDYLALCADSNSVEAEIVRDKAKFKAITEGNASDKYLRNEVKEMWDTKKKDAKEADRKVRYNRLQTKRKRYKAKYGVDI